MAPTDLLQCGQILPFQSTPLDFPAGNLVVPVKRTTWKIWCSGDHSLYSGASVKVIVTSLGTLVRDFGPMSSTH